MQSFEWLQFPQLTLVSRWLVGALFLVSALGKFRDMPAFLSVVFDYQILPPLWARRFAVALPWLEISIGLLFIFGLGTRTAAILGLVLLWSFAIAIAINLARGRRDLNCGCTGARRRQKINGRLLLRNFFLIFLSFQVLLWGPGIWALDYQIENMSRSIPLDEMILPLVMSLGGAVLLYRLFRQIVRLVQWGNR